MVKDYPETPYKEELDYLYVKSHYLLAKGSVDEKQEERYKNYFPAYDDFEAEYPESKYKNELTNLKFKSEAALKKIEKRKVEKEKEFLFNVNIFN